MIKNCVNCRNSTMELNLDKPKQVCKHKVPCEECLHWKKYRTHHSKLKWNDTYFRIGYWIKITFKDQLRKELHGKVLSWNSDSLILSVPTVRNTTEGTYIKYNEIRNIKIIKV